jgi:hypothetical protein
MRTDGRAKKLCVAGLLIAAASLAAAGSASAYVKGGKPWPHGIIRYYNTFKADSPEVAVAVAAWNHSGAHVHFVASSRSRARVIIYRWPNHLKVGFGQSCSSQDLGCASLGFVGTIGSRHYLTVGLNGKAQRKAFVYLKPASPSHLMPADMMAVVAAHELGHIIGLGHSTRCATMDAPVSASCKLPDNEFACNPLQTDDSRGAVALYGGHAHSYKVRTCGFVDPPIAPIGLTATLINQDPSAGYLGDIQISFKTPPGETVYLDGQSRNTVSGYAYTVNLGSCVAPDSTSVGDAEAPNSEVAATVQPSPAEPGAYCVAVVNEDIFGQVSPLAQADVTVPALLPGGGGGDSGSGSA